MFFDQAKINVQSGAGGNGIVAFRREKFEPLGGPNGGNGGRGGDVVLFVDPGLNTLSPYRRNIHFRAERGGHGGGANKTGANGEDLRIPVPPGTVVRASETGEIIADLVEANAEKRILFGGRGGRGNNAFKSGQNKAPRIAEKGEPNQELWIEFELKLVADIGIVGVPNAGKSTLLSVISAAKPKIADYPFTTVIPNLGVAEVNHQQMVFADIPGLMEGAHEGVGLGLDFLRHIERTRVLVHVLNGASPDPLGDYEAINQELSLFNPILAEKPQLVVFNKMDLPDAQELWPLIKEAIEQEGVPVLEISAVAQRNLQPMLYQVMEILANVPRLEPSPEEELPEITPQPNEEAFRILPLPDDEWRVEGVAIERAAHMTNWDYYEAGMRFQRILKAMGITKALQKAGVEDGDTIHIADIEFAWGYENAFGE